MKEPQNSPLPANDAMDDETTVTSGDAPADGKPCPRQAGRPGRWRVVVRALVLVAVLVLSDVLITLALEPYEAATYLSWVNYRENAPAHIDNLIVGASTALEGLDPDTIDESLGTTTFNQGFYGVSYKNVERTMTTIADERDLKRVFVGVSYESLASWPNIYSDAIFAQSKLYGESLPQQASECLEMLFDEQYLYKPTSFVFLAPWTVDNVGTDPMDVGNNIHKRLTLTPKELVATVSDYSEKGYVTHSLSGTIDLDGFASSVPLLPSGSGEEFVQANLDHISRMCAYCQDHGIEIYVIMMPRQDFNVLNLGRSYPEQAIRLQQAVEQAGGTYLDANALDPSVYRAGTDDFVDEQHLNHGGAERFSAVLSKLVSEHESGVDLASLCLPYDQWDGYAAPLAGRICLLQCSATVSGGTLGLEAIPTTGPDTAVEYQVVRVHADGSEEELRGWSADPSFSTRLEGHGSATVRVNARVQGSDAPYERYWQKDFEY
ncbi:hypothetical protein ACTND8_00880 [Atopobiaceae bacterium HCP3S3_F7]